MRNSPRGFTLFIAMVLVAVILAIGLALLDVTYKQVLLTSTETNSSAAFYNADGALECGLYWDSVDQFDYSKGAVVNGGPINCEAQNFNYNTVQDGPYYVTTFTVPCPGDSNAGDGVATTTIYKSGTNATEIYADGYNDCNVSDTHRTERGLEAHYGS